MSEATEYLESDATGIYNTMHHMTFVAVRVIYTCSLLVNLNVVLLSYSCLYKMKTIR